MDFQLASKATAPSRLNEQQNEVIRDNGVNKENVKSSPCQTISMTQQYLHIIEHGPINLTCSATNSTYVVNIIVCPPPSSSSNALKPSIHEIYRGISTSKEHWEDLNQKLNNHATKEIILSITDSTTGLDLERVENKGSQSDFQNGNVILMEEKDTWAPSMVRLDVPVSCAYYKLLQVFENDNLLQPIMSSQVSMHFLSNELPQTSQHGSINMIQSHGAGLDIGALPRGWTQALCTKLNLKSVMAVNPRLLAQREAILPEVYHIRANISSAEAIQVMAFHAPYSVVACNACLNSHLLLPKIVNALEGAATFLTQSGSVGSSLDKKHLLVWALCVVVTMKLP